MQNAFDELISILDTAEKTISELGDISIETSETEKQREKKICKNQNKISNSGATTKSVTYTSCEVEERKEGREDIFETMTTEDFH